MLNSAVVLQPETPHRAESTNGRNRPILVTGGTGVIGSSIVHALQHDGFRVYACYAHDEARAEAVQQSIGGCMRRADISDESAVHDLFASLPPLFAVIHVAGTSRNSLLAKQSVEEWNETLRINATGSFLVARAALRYMRDGGRLILTASRVGESGNAGQGAYAASKAAVIALARCAAREGGERKIAVNALCPGFVPSELTATLSEAQLEAFRQRSVLHELGAPAHVAGTVRWLLSDGASGVSGQVIHCDSRI
jgi:3-oxoacyl-[acyl-carrier protein] reductase